MRKFSTSLRRLAAASLTNSDAVSTVCAECCVGGGAGHFAQHRDDQLCAVGRAGDILRNLAGGGVLLLHKSATADV